MSREAMQVALEALDSDNPDIQLRAAIALRQALETEQEPLYWSVAHGWVYADDTSQKRVDKKAKREQEPVLWLKTWSDGSVSVLKTKSHAFADHELEPLYAAPQKAAEWVGLTDEEISDLWCKVSNTDFVTIDTHEFARAIEAKLKEKNI